MIGDDNLDTINANALAERLLGDAVYANIIMLGFAWQCGLVPISLQALLRAIELNGVAVERNKQAFAWGRIAAADPDLLPKADDTPKTETLDQLIARRADFLQTIKTPPMQRATGRSWPRSAVPNPRSTARR